LKKNYPEKKTGQGDKETGREGDEETLRTAKDKGERIKEPCSSSFLAELPRFENSRNEKCLYGPDLAKEFLKARMKAEILKRRSYVRGS
jgi:hypothetical protein